MLWSALHAREAAACCACFAAQSCVTPLPMCCLQGHFQICLSNEHCPLFQRGLPLFQRLMYCSGVWAYIVGAITTPMFIAIPLVSFLTCSCCAQH